MRRFSLALDWFPSKRGENPMTYLDDVFRYAAARLGDREEAEDIAIETVQALPNPCSKDNLRHYMLGMARRKVADRLRKRRPTQPLLESDVSYGFTEASDSAATVAQVLGRLSEEHREVLVLKYINGLSSREIGNLSNRGEDAVNSQLQRARDAFGQQWNLLTDDEVKL